MGFGIQGPENAALPGLSLSDSIVRDANLQTCANSKGANNSEQRPPPLNTFPSQVASVPRTLYILHYKDATNVLPKPAEHRNAQAIRSHQVEPWASVIEGREASRDFSEPVASLSVLV